MNLQPTTDELDAAVFRVVTQFPRTTRRVRSAVVQQSDIRATMHEIEDSLARLRRQSLVMFVAGRWRTEL